MKNTHHASQSNSSILITDYTLSKLSHGFHFNKYRNTVLTTLISIEHNSQYDFVYIFHNGLSNFNNQIKLPLTTKIILQNHILSLQFMITLI